MESLLFGWNLETAAWLCRAVQTGTAVTLTGTAVMRLLTWKIDPGVALPRWNRSAAIAWGTLLLATGFQLALVTAQMGGLPLWQVWRSEMLPGVLNGTHFGRVWQAQVVLLFALLLTDVFGRVAQSKSCRRYVVVADIVAALLAAASAASLVATGHAQASDARRWLLPVDMLHATTAGAWPGGLIPLAFLFSWAGLDAERLAFTIAVTKRFSRLSVVAVGVMLVSGSLNSFALVGSVAGFWASGYGRMVFAKGLLFAVMVGVGALNKQLIEREPVTDMRNTIQLLWRNVTIETVVGVGVLLVTAALSMGTPPAAQS